MKKRCLITGCSGFIGSHLAGQMLEEGWTVFGTFHRTLPEELKFNGEIQWVKADVENAASLRALLAKVEPQVIFHLANQAYVGPSWSDPEGTFRTNIGGTLHLLEAIRLSQMDPRVVVTGSSAAYGFSRQGEGPLSEESTFRPGSPYAASKIAEEMLSYTYGRGYNLRIVRVRPFAVIGPRKVGDAVSDFCRGIVRIERGESKALSIGDLNRVRDFVDVRDAVKAFCLLADKGQPAEVYNLCTGVGRNLREVLDTLVAMATRPVKVVSDPQRFRRSDDSILVGDPGRLKRLGWNPEVPLRQTLEDTLEFWRRLPSGSKILSNVD